MSARKKDHYKMNRILLSSIGQWPLQSSLHKFLFTFHAIFAMVSQMYLQMRALIAAWNDWDLVIECTSPLLLDVLCLMKLFTCLFNMRKMKLLYLAMEESWNLVLSDEQIKILEKYTRMGTNMAKTYAVTLYSATVGYVTLPHVPTAIAFFSNTNETVERALLFHVEDVVDVEKYYYLILFHSCYTIVFLITLPIAADAMYLSYVHHACGLFSVVGYQIENIQDGNDLNINADLPTSEDKAYKKIVDSIIKHKSTLQFAELLNSIYSTSFLFQTGLNVMVFTFNGVETVIYADKVEEFLRFGMTSVTVGFHFLFLNFPGQLLIDHSLEVNNSIYYSNWYAISNRSRKLLNLMLMRSRIPAEITAGKICTMSLENYSSVMRAAMSYFTMLSSVR